MTRDVVYPSREKPRNDSLRYSLRSLANVAHGRVFIVGHRPAWIDPAAVTHIRTVQDSDAFTNVGRALQAVLESDVSEDFYWWQDDLFALTPAPGDLPLRARLQPLDTYVATIEKTLATGATYHRQYVAGVRSQRDMLRAWGYDTATLHNGCCHYPTPISKPLLKETVARIADTTPAHPLGHFKAVYAAPHTVEKRRDCKVMGTRATVPDGWPFVSTSAAAWKGPAGKQLMARFPEPSPYERT